MQNPRKSILVATITIKLRINDSVKTPKTDMNLFTRMFRQNVMVFRKYLYNKRNSKLLEALTKQPQSA